MNIGRLLQYPSGSLNEIVSEQGHLSESQSVHHQY